MSGAVVPRAWCRACGPISEEAVRRLHWPNYRHRFSMQQYAPGTLFDGLGRSSTCYVLSGACEFTSSGDSCVLSAEQFAALPEGPFSFKVLGGNDVVLLSVYELPFDVVHDRRDAIEYLEDRGVYASARDCKSGETLVAHQLPEEHRGVTVWRDALWLAPEADGWFVEDPSHQLPERKAFPSLKAACDHVIAAWQKPDWRRLRHEEAKQLLARSRAARLSEPRKLEILDEYLGTYADSDVAEAIQDGDLPLLDEAAVALLAKGELPESFPPNLEPLLRERFLMDLEYVLNAYLREELRSLGHEVVVEGQMEQGGLCPCCEYLAIKPGEDGLWDICPVCFWENGGDGPNHMTLAEARKRFDDLGAVEQRFTEHLSPDRRRRYRRAWAPHREAVPPKSR